MIPFILYANFYLKGIIPGDADMIQYFTGKKSFSSALTSGEYMIWNKYLGNGMPEGGLNDVYILSFLLSLKALILPSAFESLSISVLESLNLNVPVIVNGDCEVLKGHCIKSNAGLYYHNYFEFEGCLNYLLSHEKEYEQMRDNAREYIDKYFQWNIIVEKFKNIIEKVAQ